MIPPIWHKRRSWANDRSLRLWTLVQTGLFLCFLLLPRHVEGQSSPIVASETYSFHAGDIVGNEWAQPEYDDSGWEVLGNGEFDFTLWTGSGLFRQVIHVDSTLQDVPYAVALSYAGAAELYVDGELVHRYGKVGSSSDTEVVLRDLYPNPRGLEFSGPLDAASGTSTHVVAVRLTRHALEHPSWTGFEMLINFRFGSAEELSSRRASVISKISIHRLFAGVGLAFALVHFMLFFFYRRQRANLYFASLALCSGILAFFNFAYPLSVVPTNVIWSIRLNNVTALVMALVGLRLMYYIYEDASPRRFLIFVGCAVVLAVVVLLRPYQSEEVLAIFVGVVLLEIVRTAIAARMSGKSPTIEGTGILEVGMGIVCVVVLHDLLVGLDVLPALWDPIDFPQVRFATLGLLGAMSVMLALDFGRTKQALEEQLDEVRELSAKAIRQERERSALEAENRRKQAELDDARRLQLSMLPSDVPHRADLAIDAYMQTASEVGGDFYDFFVHDDGALTIAIGDATGHGLPAGTMVAATKSLFGHLAGNADLVGILRDSSRAIRQVGLPGMYMAFGLVRLEGSRLSFAGAGMPPALVCRAATGLVERVPLRGMPLGGMAGYPYESRTIELRPGDTVVLMSDGFPEAFNVDGEMFGYEHAADVLADVGNLAPGEVITYLVDAATTWMGPNQPTDDMTFVVMRTDRNFGLPQD